MAQTKNSIIKEQTFKFIEDYKQNLLANPNNAQTPDEIETNLINQINDMIEIYNVNATKGRTIRYTDTLSFAQIADLMNNLFDIIKIPANDKNSNEDTDMLAIYINEGENKGIYSTSEATFRTIAYQFNYNLTDKDFREILNVLKTRAKRKNRCKNQDLIAVNNGIFNYKTKELLDFTPEYVFLAKSRVNYNPNATNINIYNDDDKTNWNVEDWMNELSDDPEIVNLLWEILGAVIRPYVSWDKSAWLYSTRGMNGKGTLCELMRNICGDESYASIPVSAFGERFQLEPLTRATAIIVDENDVGSFVDKAANLKAVVTNDVILIDRKHKEPIPYQFHGFMVQCMNEFPRFKDRTDSFYRRQLFIPMDKQFRGRERKYIKDDYLQRKEVLEYVLFKVLNMDYYKLSEPQVCKDLLNDFKNFNDPVREFFYEFKDEFTWDVLPYTFLFDLYKEWFDKNQPSGTKLGRNSFIIAIKQIVETDDDWTYDYGGRKIPSTGTMDRVEPLIISYNLTDWKNKNYKGNNPDKIAMTTLAAYYRGIERLGKKDNNDNTTSDKNTKETKDTEKTDENINNNNNTTDTKIINDKKTNTNSPEKNNIENHKSQEIIKNNDNTTDLDNQSSVKKE